MADDLPPSSSRVEDNVKDAGVAERDEPQHELQIVDELQTHPTKINNMKQLGIIGKDDHLHGPPMANELPSLSSRVSDVRHVGVNTERDDPKDEPQMVDELPPPPKINNMKAIMGRDDPRCEASRVDDSPPPAKKIKFSAVNIAGPGFTTNPDEVTLAGCECGLPSCSDLCPCVVRFGANYSKDGRLVKLDKGSDDHQDRATKPVVECNAMCKCGEQCRNRVVQNGPQFNLEVFTTERKGSGLRTLENIPRHSFVCEYAGELLTRFEARKRLRNLHDRDQNYILVVREFASEGEVTETIIDPTYQGNLGRYINHSCDPNLFKVPVRVHNDIPRVALFAKRDIDPGEELTYSYGDEVDNNMESRTIKRKTCHCGSDSCSGYLPVDHSLLR